MTKVVFLVIFTFHFIVSMRAVFFLFPLTFLFVSCSKPFSQVGGGQGYLAAFRAPVPAGRAQPLGHEEGYWDGDAVGGEASIRIVRNEQKAYFYKGSQLVGVSPISTGKSTHTTPPGSFKISQKSANHKSSLYGVIRDKATGQIVNADADTRKHRAKAGQVFENAPMPYFMRFNGAIGMHVGHLPGYAASHGCVRMPRQMAVKFFENVRVGTPVIVQ